MAATLSHAILAILISVPAALADFSQDAVPAAPDILNRIISGAAQSGEPLSSHHTQNESTVYYLRSAVYIGECSAPFGPVHVARLFFIRSGVPGQVTPPPRGHTFIVFLDREFAVRGRWEVGHTFGQLSVSGSKLLLDDKELFDYAHPPPAGGLVVDGELRPIPQWK